MTIDQGFRLHPGAAFDITEIWEFIAKENPPAARRVRGEILDAIRKLVPFPHQGHRRNELTSRPLRFHVVRNYLSMRRSTRRSPRVMAAILRGRE